MTNSDVEVKETFHRRKSPILNKCEDLMQILWNEGYRQQITWNLLRDYVIKCCGGFRTTIQDYLGKRAEYFKSRGREGCLKTPSKKGYLEKFGFIEFLNRQIVYLDHERVDRDYHRNQVLIDGVNFSHTFSPNIETVESIETEGEERDTNRERN